MANTIEYGQGAVNNTIGWGQGAKVGGSSFSNTKSILLDGVDDAVLTNNAYTHLSSGTAMTVSVWFKSSTYTTSGRLMFVGKHVEILQNSASFSNTQGTFTYKVLGNFGNSFATMGGNTQSGVANLVDGNWHHICLTWDGSTTTAVVYEDGVAKITNTSASGTLNSSTTEAYAVGAKNNGSNPINGTIDEPAIWTSALSASDVTAIYNSGVPNNLNDSGVISTPPTTWYRCGDGDTAPTLTDNGSGGDDGIMRNFTTFSTDVPT